MGSAGTLITGVGEMTCSVIQSFAGDGRKDRLSSRVRIAHGWVSSGVLLIGVRLELLFNSSVKKKPIKEHDLVLSNCFRVIVANSNSY